MSAQFDVEAMSPQDRSRYERKREHEFYSYYEPLRILSGAESKCIDLKNPEYMAQHKATSSTDRALTAFCQLAALRLNARRAIIICFDSQYGYVLSEGTRSLSFEDDGLHEDSDGLWLGVTKIERDVSVCEHTINLPNNLGSNAQDDTSGMIHIVNDLYQDARFCDKPYVVGDPKARFYAGVPIRTARGLNIGSILDDEPRPGLASKDVRFLQEMGSLVMDHLDMLKSRAEQRRGTLMVKALSVFMDNEARTQDDTSKSPIAVTRKQLDTIAHATEPAELESVESPNHGPDQMSLQQKLEDENALLTTGRTLTSLAKTNTNIPSPNTNGQRPPISRRSSNRSVSSASPKRDDDPLRARDQIASNAMQSAADLVRTAVGADGVLFLDASMSNFGELADESIDNAKPDRDSELLTSDTEGTGSATDTLEKPSTQEEDTKACPVFGASYGLVPPDFTPPHAEVPKRLLQSLLRCHKHGKVFIYGADGDYTSDTHTSDGSGATGIGNVSPYTATGRYTSSSASHKRKRSTRSTLGKKLGSLFPQARSLMLLGLWNMNRDRWDAGCIVYSNSPFRVFSAEHEMSYLKAFCDVITAKIGRLDVEMAHKVKSDFMSSISHELRSPLHGILGTAEFIQDQIHDNETAEMISQIQICGQTLLDVVDHLLDFSKVNQVSKHKRKQLHTAIDQKHRNRSAEMSGKAATLGGMVMEKANVLLDELTEEVIDTAVYSFCCSKDGSTLSDRRVTVITDIDSSAESLSCSIAVGAWKRLCINLVNNALKYTPEKGYIIASLKLMPPAERQRRSRVRLAITDTGRGMSKEFLSSQLFRAFAQEDDLSEGTGLGMSMVAKIVKSLGGLVDVQSKKSVGTTVTVTVPLDLKPGWDVQRIHQRTLSSGPTDISIHFLGAAITENEREDAVKNGRAMQVEALHKACRQLDMTMSSPAWSTSHSSDLTMVTEEDVAELLHLLRSEAGDQSPQGSSRADVLKKKPLLVICRDCRSRRDMKISPLDQLIMSHVEYVSQPCGPHKLANAVRKCLSSTPSDSSWSEHSTTPQANMMRHPSDNGFPFPQRRPSKENSPSASDWDQRRPVGSPGSSVLSPLPKDSPMDGFEQRVLTSRAKSPTVKSPGGTLGVNVDPSKPALLLVDDNAVNLRLITAYAKKHGHARLTATNGLEAVEAYRAAALGTGEHGDIPKPEVILMDISMPIMDGFEATRQIRAFEQTNDIPPACIIALTGLGSADAQDEAFVSGIDLFLTKPIKLDKLTKSLEELRDGKLEAQKSDS